MDLRNRRDWDCINGLLSVNMLPNAGNDESRLYVLLNGSTGNFCLDYTDDIFNKSIAIQRAWSSDTGYYVKILPGTNNVKITRWWDGYEEEIPSQKVIDNPANFYKAITKSQDSRIANSIISFAKEAFIKLRNCIQHPDNGQQSLRMFMYLLASLEDDLNTPSEVEKNKWMLNDYDINWISNNDWQQLSNAFKIGINNVKPLVNLVLRHASNRLFQEAHREATKKTFQTVMFGGADRDYNSGISDGAYYTPTPLVRTIVQEALWALDKVKPLIERDSLRILDPACGSAEFLRETLRQLKMKGYAGAITIAGWDISEIACEISKFVLHYESRSEWNNAINLLISNRDSLSYNWAIEQRFDVVLMNPPFTSFENLGERKSIVQEGLSGYIKGQPDGAALFWKKAAEIVKDEGVLGLVLPHSFLGAETYDKLRNYLKENLKMEFSLVGRLGSAGLFEKAMIIPYVLVGTKNVRPVANTVLWTDFQQSSAYEALRELRKYRLNEIPVPFVTPTYSIYENEQLTDKVINKNWVVSSHKMYLLSQKLKGFDTVRNIFKVSRGVDTGNNAAFLLSKNEWLELPKNERPYFKPCVMKESIQNGQLNDKLYLFYPYKKYAINSEHELVEKTPKYFDLRLMGNKTKLKKRKGFEERWWLLNRERSLPNTPKIISSYFGKSGYFAFDKTGEYIVGQSFAWMLKKEDGGNEVYYFAYLALLHSPIIDKLLEMVCNVLDGGYFDLSKHYVENMPLPDLSMVDREMVNILSKFGENINEGKSIDKNNLNQVVANAYGLDIEFLK